MLLSHHPDETILEAYCLAKLDGAALDNFEDHLILCAECQDRCTEMDGMLQGMRYALAQNVPERANYLEKVGDFFRMPVPVWATATVAAAGVAGILVTQATKPQNAPLALALSATRGGNVPVTRISGALDLDLDTRDLAESGTFHIQLVNADGLEVWSSDQTGANGHLHALVNKRLSAGQYYVRVADPAGVRREFSLRLGN